MGKQNRCFDFSHKFYCCKCGNQGITIARKRNQYREQGHLKKLYCLHCKQEVNFCECDENYTYEDFLFEFENGNFDQEQNRIYPIREFAARVNADHKNQNVRGVITNDA